MPNYRRNDHALRDCPRERPKKLRSVYPRFTWLCRLAKSLAEVPKLITEAVVLHLEGLREDGLPIPEPSSSCEYVDVA